MTLPSRRHVAVRLITAFTRRPLLVTALALGLIGWLALGFTSLDRVTANVLGWNITGLWFICGSLLHMRGGQADKIRQVAARQDEGQGLILGFVLVACIVGLMAVAVELGAAKSVTGVIRAGRVGLAVWTVAECWFLVQLIFALHYAHRYYEQDDDLEGGLAFLGGEPPDYWDFLHFSLVLGAASQTADVAFTSKQMRRLGTLHTVVAFAFNTAILALTINLMAALV